jgi:hypothetical protein
MRDEQVALWRLRMRYLLLPSALAILTGCTSGRIRPEDLAYVREAQYQSLAAYKICNERNVSELWKCDALLKLHDADQKRLERLTSVQ